ncbi:uncharacterized protein LOC108675998 [Hyalella azteca]|uniref:Uncharacterized protein LOC108675998 n=1 Tax=Hyalella azteca TaxID=294128 RepID=A0A8B7P3B9_HYAAZ|nr:uncharacterized protein LOC108675998 [Hyalella azteca]
MGNQSSRNNHHHPPPSAWTQSFPRETRRLQKMGVTNENRVLPERVPVQRLRPTENGRSLHVAGTITGRRATNTIEPHPLQPSPMGHQSLPGYVSPMSTPCRAHPNGPSPSMMHSNSLTHLHQPCAIHPSPRLDPSRGGSMHDLRFGYPPSKVYTSEPDLRAGSHPVAMPVPHSPHTIVSQSPTKGRIKSKKRNRAPPPPGSGALSDGYVHDNGRAGSEVQRAVHWGTSDTHSRPPSQVSSSRSKSRKIGLFKKKSDGRKSDNESYFTDDQCKSRYNRSTSSDVSKQEKRERARSVDCLQHELRNSVSDPKGEASMQGFSSDETSSSSREKEIRPRSQTIERDSRRTARENSVERRISTTMERNPRYQSRESQSRIDDPRSKTKLEGRRSHDLQYSRQFVGPYDHQKISRDLERRASYSVARVDKPIDKAFEEWDKAERDELRRKRISDTMKNEILSVGKNLKKSSPDILASNVGSFDDSQKKSSEKERKTSVTENNNVQDKETPKMFFFGMKPSGDGEDVSNTRSPATRIIETEQVRIEGNAVEFSKRNAEVIERSRSRSKIRNSDAAEGKCGVEDNRRIANDVDDFAVAVERRSRNNFVEDNMLNNSLRREDGGYHSRQNSGSFHLENENQSDEDMGVTVNLRPILPKRQREIPRFSPNAAWRFLGEEPFLPGENLNESRSSEEVDAVFEDKILGFSRPVAPPRGSGEKSADSGISGDAGSPGPMQEFEAIKIVAGPLAVSSPVVSGRSDARRAWTPAQDLDENSLDGSGEPAVNGVTQNNRLSTPPKLTSRANMFNLFGLKEYRANNGFLNSDEEEKAMNQSKTSTTMDESTQTVLNFRKLKRSVSGSANNTPNSLNFSPNARKIPEDNGPKSEDHPVQNDKWRENWSMTRSIPNSLNNYKESDCLVRRDGRPGEDPQNLQYRRFNSESNAALSRQSSSSHLQSNQSTGHIMYLPEYNSLKVSNDESAGREIRSRDLNSSKHLFKSNASENVHDFRGETEGTNFFVKSKGQISMTDFSPISRLRKGKKFSYQSTVRVLEKKMIEEKLNREIAAKEQQRLQEAAAMKRVEEEFQLKREREKKRLQQQLKLYKAMQGSGDSEDPFSADGSFLRSSSLDYPIDQQKEIMSDDADAFIKSQDYRSSKINPGFEEEIPNGSHSSTNSYINGHTRSDVNNSSKEDDERFQKAAEFRGNINSIADELKSDSARDVRQKIVSQRYTGNETTSSSVSSVSAQSRGGESAQFSRRRPAPEGAPATHNGSPNARAEALQAARHRSGMITQELPEHQQPRREYREYRRSQRPASAQGGISDNYRRDFSRGQAQVALDDLSCRLSSDGRRSRDDRPSASDLLETASSCSSVPRYPGGRQPVVVKTHIIRTPAGAGGGNHKTHVTKYYEHPPAVGNMARPSSPYQFPSEAYNRHVVQPYRSARISPTPNNKLLRT